MSDFTTDLRLEVQTARNDAFVWGVSTWTGYRWAGPADTPESGVEWLDILGSSHEIAIQRGAKRDGLTISLEAGTLQATVFDAQVDPNTNPYIKPGTPIRLVRNAGLGDVHVFKGVLTVVSVTYRGKKPQVTLAAVDKVKDLANTNRSGVVGGTFAQRVDDLLAKHGIPFTIDGGADVLLAQNAYDSSLLNHMTIAATSAQGNFFVSKDNTVKAYGNGSLPAGPALITFTDERAVDPSDVEYTDIVVRYDSDNLANDIYVENLTYGLNEEMEPLSINTKYGPYRNVTSIATFGAFTETVTTTLPAEIDVANFASTILADNDAPELRVDSVRFNASEDREKAAGLEVFDLVNVEYTTEAFHIGEDFRVLALTHKISASPDRHTWLVDVDLISIGGGSL